MYSKRVVTKWQIPLQLFAILEIQVFRRQFNFPRFIDLLICKRTDEGMHIPNPRQIAIRNPMCINILGQRKDNCIQRR